MRKLIWLLLVLVVLALAADRGGDYLAEQALATRVQQRADLRETPKVEIAGFPFLTQLYAQRIDEITVDADQVKVGEGQRTLTVANLAITLDDVTTDRRFRSFAAATGRATARITYDELGRLLGLKLVYAGKGAVRATATIDIAGRKLRPAFTLVPRVANGALAFRGRFGNGLPAPVRRELNRLFGFQVPLDGLPFSIKPTAISAQQDAVVLELAGKDVLYNR